MKTRRVLKVNSFFPTGSNIVNTRNVCCEIAIFTEITNNSLENDQEKA
jgi:hypothetical protein